MIRFPLFSVLLFVNMTETPTIVQCGLDGQNCRPIITNDIVQPEALVVDVEEELLFWFDRGFKETHAVYPSSDPHYTIGYGTIYRATFDGLQRITLVRNVGLAIAMTVFR